MKGFLADQARSTEQLVFRQLSVQYKALGLPPINTPPPTENKAAGAPPEPDPTTGLRISIDECIKKGETQGLTWLELYDLESLILRVMNDDRLRDESWSIREEFRNLATDQLYRSYIASKPPADPRNLATPLTEVRRDVENLLRKLHELRLGRSLLDVIRAYTTALTFAITLLLVAGTILVALTHVLVLPTLCFVVIGGVFGAGLSMLQRLSRIPSKGDLVARYPAASRRIVWILTPLLSLTQGALAATVLYFLFRAGLIKGDLFPQFADGSVMPTTAVTPATDPARAVSALQNLLQDSITDVAAGAKLLVWSLVAGFAERLVPDLLTRLSDQADKKTDSKSA